MPATDTDKAINRLIGRNIRLERLKRGLSQTELGAAVGVTCQQVQKYESGANRTTISRLVHIAHALGTPIAVLLHGIPETGGPAQPHHDASPSLKAERHAARLLATYSRITCVKLRKRIAGLVEEIACMRGQPRRA